VRDPLRDRAECAQAVEAAVADNQQVAGGGGGVNEGVHGRVVDDLDLRRFELGVTSVGVIVGVSAFALTGWRVLDPVVALAVGGNIVFTGISLIRRSGGGLMDRVLPDAERTAIDQALAPFAGEGVGFHAFAHTPLRPPLVCLGARPRSGRMERPRGASPARASGA